MIYFDIFYLLYYTAARHNDETFSYGAILRAEALRIFCFMAFTLPYRNHDFQQDGPQYLEDIATGYWFSEVLFTAVEMEIFTLLGDEGETIGQLARKLKLNTEGLERFLHALGTMGLVTKQGRRVHNTRVSADYLVRNKTLYQGDSILWRKHLMANWRQLDKSLFAGGRITYNADDQDALTLRVKQYISAMDSIARIKASELVAFFPKDHLKGRILDVGAGSGAMAMAFLNKFPLMQATLMDLPIVLSEISKHPEHLKLDGRLHYQPANILENWQVRKRHFDLVILSNILHAYSREELPHILSSARTCLKKNGLLLIHDFFLEHNTEKAALSDLNMFINTFNGRVFSGKTIQKELSSLGLQCTPLIPLKSDTAVIFAAHNQPALQPLQTSSIDTLVTMTKDLGLSEVYRIPVKNVVISDWTVLKCQFGCRNYGRAHCPPNSPKPEKTRSIISDYTQALLLVGEPPTRSFQLNVLKAEQLAFKTGFYKVFSFWAGPCSLCNYCPADGTCSNTLQARPSMEGSGIDVFATGKNAGVRLKTLKSKGEYVKYLALLLLE